MAREHEDIVEVVDQYHLFIWAWRVNPCTFEKIVSGPLTCGVREGVSYRVVHVSYLAWTLPQSPPENATRLVMERDDLSKKIAVYDLSQAYAGEPICLKLNETNSIVFEEFEKFLNIEYGLELRPKLPPLPPEHIPSEPIELSE